MPKKLTTSQWMDRIRNGQRFQQEFALSQNWDRYKGYYRHMFQKGQVPVNLMYSILRAMVPQVYLRNPSVTATARKPGLEYEMFARILQRVDNWLIKSLLIKPEFKKMIADNFLCGISTGFIGYDSLYGVKEELLDPQLGLSLSQYNDKGYRTEYNSVVTPGMPWFLRARPDDVIFPWGCESIHNAEWVALRVFRSPEDIKADPKYKNTKNIDQLHGSSTPKRSQPAGAINQEPFTSLDMDQDKTYVEMFEIHDAYSGRVLVVTPDFKDYLRDDPDALSIDGLNAEVMTFNPDPDYIYGIPDARIIEPQLLELTEIRTQAMKHRRIDLAKFLYQKGAITETEMQKLTSGEVGAGVEIDSDGDLRNAVVTLTNNVSGVLQDLALSGDIVQADVREMVGFSRVAQGQFQGKTHVSAEETKRVFQSLNIRLDERRDMITDTLTSIVRRFNQIIFKYWTQERVVDIIGPDGAQWWLKFTGPQIKAEYDIEIVPEEGPELDTRTKFDMGTAAAKTWAELNAGAIAQGAPVPPEIQRLLFSSFKGMNVEKLMAQTEAANRGLAPDRASAMGGSASQAVSPGLAAQIMQQGRA